MSDKEAILKRKPSDEEGVDGTKKSKLSFNIGLKKSPAAATENKTFKAKPLIKPKIRIAPVSIKLGASVSWILYRILIHTTTKIILKQ